ncbi:heparan-alpha-glucosaminide N-acetyltransferase-like isoform X2 [Nylanderia fulva]|uniref:heparan-alpha-glucosaminide N-acetyltransferase-like isoform X2 n=1 Tax=Nylanderia fulva TaxID=613905 RepID=UPI0010FB8974|nr:heparan-alpha-glucosaminide N-acetyltransferase-like isoform X2 [Nylanderia fulva]
MDKFSCFYEPLKFDEACVNVISDNNYTWLYSLSTDCLSCPYKRIAQISANDNSSLKFNTVETIKWRVFKNNGTNEYISAKITSDIFCELLPNLGQYGLYKLIVQNNTCSCRTLRNPTYPYSEFFIILGIIVFSLFAISTGRSLWYKFKKQCIINMKEEEMPNSNKGATIKRRIKAIDTFRGVSTLFMIFINDGSGSYTKLGHATWNGMLLGDLVFPCFIWIMGVCMPIALSAQLKRGLSKFQISYSILKRSFFLFLIGVALNTLGTNAQLENIRIFGVLQRFGIAYLTVGLLYLCFTPQQSTAIRNLPQIWIIRKMQDVLSLLPHWCVMLTLLTVHCALTFGLPIPGCPTGYLGPGGRHEDGKYFNCTGGAAGYIDRILLTSNHIYQRPIIDSVYGSGPFDPEGILGMNALVLYVGHMMCYQIFPFHWKIGAMDSRALCLIESIWVVILWTVIAYVMHHKRIYIAL